MSLGLGVQIDELDFDLPPELIAQRPVTPRDSSRLMRYQRATKEVSHHVFRDLPELLRRGDLLVFNDAKVLPAKFTLIRPTGGRVGGLFLEEPRAGEWIALLKGLGPVRPEVVYRFEDCESEIRDQKSEISQKPEAGAASGLTSALTSDLCPLTPGPATARIIEHLGEGRYRLLVEGPPAPELLDRIGAMPLPPYIHRGHDEPEDRQRYQTVFAREPGSVAAPTAGLHFTPELLARLDERGIGQTSITLHVGLGTFRPISTGTIEAHQMYSERYTIPPAAAEAINAARREGRRVIAVGTTSARVLESQPAGRELEAHSGETAIFIRPVSEEIRDQKSEISQNDQGSASTSSSGLTSDLCPLISASGPLSPRERVVAEGDRGRGEQVGFPRHVDALITNFHLPRSTLIALVAALVGLEEQRRLYRLAIEQRYRFFSYGDAMLLE